MFTFELTEAEVEVESFSKSNCVHQRVQHLTCQRYLNRDTVYFHRIYLFVSATKIHMKVLLGWCMMGPWIWESLCSLAFLELANRCFSYTFDASWYEDFALYGGVPRYVIPKCPRNLPRQDLERALADRSGEIVTNFFKFSFGIISSQESYLLVHINSSVTDANYEYDGATVYSFASNAIFKSLADMHTTHMPSVEHTLLIAQLLGNVCD